MNEADQAKVTEVLMWVKVKPGSYSEFVADAVTAPKPATAKPLTWYSFEVDAADHKRSGIKGEILNHRFED